MKKLILFKYFLALSFLFCCFSASAQMITGVWQGRINKQKVEVKIVLKGDSLAGTAYYYQSPTSYRRYSIKGYFDGPNNEAVWWDDELLDENLSRISIASPGKLELISRADFDCPGVGIMKLDGTCSSRDDEDKSKGEVHIKKVGAPVFRDEWDHVIENYTVGSNNPRYIDSIEMIARRTPIAAPTEKVPESYPVATAKPVVKNEPSRELPAPLKPLSIEEKFVQRHKVPTLEIPVSGDSIELHFYDNAEIDGDSISLFLNDRLIFEHIFLTDKPFIVTLSVKDLLPVNELVMVAENLGSIPPNTSFMIAYVAGIRYEARLESTEGSSAMIRFRKDVPE
ncbi:MAG: hypothetical protein KIT80_00685 [Chitinophagaceae bacterium]|nr:hypothetical protein [Chitinophagaceae bacterium]MCW5925406.1 hypothetical protein [Chitinophagaceae bacterium]